MRWAVERWAPPATCISEFAFRSQRRDDLSGISVVTVTGIRVVGGLCVLSHMVTTFIWGGLLSLLACAVAVLSEGRGRHALKVLLGLAPRTEKLNAYDDVPRPDAQWDVIGYLTDPRMRTGEVPVRAIAAPTVVKPKEITAKPAAEPKAHVSGELVVAAGPANMLRAPKEMPPAIKPRRREAVSASR